jgi:hypothetical protein
VISEEFASLAETTIGMTVAVRTYVRVSYA